MDSNHSGPAFISTPRFRNAASAAPNSPTLLATRRCDPASVRSDSCSDPRLRACRPGVRSSRTAESQTPHPFSSRQAPAVFSHDRLQHFFIQAEVGYQMFQPALFILQAFQSLRLAYFEAAVLTLPGVDCCFAYPVLTRQIRYLAACFVLLQDADDLLFVEIAPSSSLDPPSSLTAEAEILNSTWSSLSSARHTCLLIVTAAEAGAIKR